MKRAKLATKNEYIDELNELIIKQFSGDEVIYHSFNSAIDEN